jgi:hypothetical protein
MVSRRASWTLRRLLPASLIAAVLALSTIGTASANASPARIAVATTTITSDPQQAADIGATNAAAHHVTQSITIIDRTNGAVVASHHGDRVFSSESIVKLFTAAYYLEQADGKPDASMAKTLQTMIEKSDDSIESSLWKAAIITTVAERYELTDTHNAGNASSKNWGSGKINADDEAHFLYAMSQDPQVGPTLMPWMAAAAPQGSDGFNQSFGLNAMTGDHGSKQGWSDPGFKNYNLHSVGWTGKYFVAILQTSPSASTATMRKTSTFTASLLTNIGQDRAATCATDNDVLPAAIIRRIVAAIAPGGPAVWCAA